MKNLLAAVVIGLATLSGLTAVPTQAQAYIAAGAGWQYAGAYPSAKEARRKCDSLRAKGYQTCIKMQSGQYCVYCR